jgi:hypothetical protein
VFKICSKPLVATRKNETLWRGVYGHILSARACSMRDVRAIEAALALRRVWLVISELTAERPRRRKRKAA